jgi:hypothetical protein
LERPEFPEFERPEFPEPSSADEARRLKALESENGKLKKLLADRLLEIDVLKEINSKKW